MKSIIASKAGLRGASMLSAKKPAPATPAA